MIKVALALVALLCVASPVAAAERVAVLVVDFPWAPQSPYPDSTLLQWTSDEAVRVDDFYREQSYGIFAMQSSVFGVYTLDLPSTATRTTVALAAKAAATDVGVDLSQFTYFMFILPSTDVIRAGVVDANGAWIAADSRLTIPDFSTMAHEIGHQRWGLGHAHSLKCDDGTPLGGRRAQCTFSEYGDGFDVMGSGHGHFNAIKKMGLGWLPNAAIAASGDYLLAPFELMGGLRAVSLTNKNGLTYVLEYRQRIGFDALYHSDDEYAGVIVHVPANGSELLYMTPFDDSRQTLGVGSSYCDKGGQLSFSVLSADSLGLVLRVQFGSRCL